MPAILRYDTPSNQLYLQRDDGSALMPSGMALGSGIPGAKLENSQCIIWESSSTVTIRDPIFFTAPNSTYVETGGKELVLRLNVEFKPAFGGDRAVYIAARNIGDSLNSGWKTRGAWKVSGTDSSFPKVRLLSGANSAGPFVAEIYGLNSANVNLSWRLSLMINTDLNANNACWMVFVNEANAMYLQDPASPGGWGGFGIPSTGPSITNPQCTLSPTGSSVARSSDRIQVTFNAALASGFAASKMVYGAAYTASLSYNSGWKPLGPTTQPDPGVAVSFPVIAGSSKLEANLGPMPLDYYNSQVTNCRNVGLCESDVTERYVPTCSHLVSVRACYQAAFAGYASSGITGLRFQFAVCGSAASKAFSGCGKNVVVSFNPVSLWATNFRNFYADMYAAGIRRITPTPAMPGWGDDEGIIDQPGGPTDCQPTLPSNQSAWPAVRWYPMSPFPYTVDGIPYLAPAGQFAYTCAPTNPENFVGWDKLFEVYRFVIQSARTNPGGALEIEEFDMANEQFLGLFDIQGRLLVDNKTAGVDPYTNQDLLYTPVLETVRKMMVDNYFDPSRVTISAIPGGPNQAGFDCGTPYGDSARLIHLSALMSAIGGGNFGQPFSAGDDLIDDSTGLRCGGVLEAGSTKLPKLPGPAMSAPSIIDLHLGASLSFGDGAPRTYQTQAQSALEGQVTLTNVKSFMNSFCPGGWRNPSGNPALPLCKALYMNGEIPLYAPNNPLLYGGNCDESPLAAPAGTIAGFNASTLVNHKLPSGATGVIFRPWVDPVNVVPGTKTCYQTPHPLTTYFISNP